MLGQDAGSGRVIREHRNRRVEAHGRTEDGTEFRVGGDTRRVDVGIGDVCRQRQLVEEVAFLGFKRNVGVVRADGQTVVIGLAIVAAHDTILLEITQGDEIRGLFRTAAHGDQSPNPKPQSPL